MKLNDYVVVRNVLKVDVYLILSTWKIKNFQQNLKHL